MQTIDIFSHKAIVAIFSYEKYAVIYLSASKTSLRWGCTENELKKIGNVVVDVLLSM